MSKRLNGGELLIDLTPYGTFTTGDLFEDHDVPQKVLDDIKANCVLDSDGLIKDIRKPLLIKINIDGYVVILNGGVIDDDLSVLRVYGLNNNMLIALFIPNDFLIESTGIVIQTLAFE